MSYKFNNYHDNEGYQEQFNGPSDDYYGDQQDGYDDDYYPQALPPPHLDKPSMFGNNRNSRYIEAYGNYRGGYGPGGGFGPMPPGFRPWGPGFGPDSPLPRKSPRKDYQGVINYLIRCGVTKENLKNLPNNLLRLYEPFNCGLCAMPLDSFTISKMHYISKNHIKNQKKWLCMNPKSTLKNGGEWMPIKSRELYCELCDVEMTSKSHADAHYSGKPHAAIVLGRKKPRNPILNQSAMEDRLNVLIAREKRYMKMETNSQSKPKEEAVKELKNAPPELTCTICNTVVTCSEQMTSHMNGKKHLSKEKQYILKQMKGESKKPARASKAKADGKESAKMEEEVGEENEEEEVGEENEEEEDETADEDWAEPWEMEAQEP